MGIILEGVMLHTVGDSLLPVLRSDDKVTLADTNKPGSALRLESSPAQLKQREILAHNATMQCVSYCTPGSTCWLLPKLENEGKILAEGHWTFFFPAYWNFEKNSLWTELIVILHYK